jgi:hypothetical protein
METKKSYRRRTTATKALTVKEDKKLALFVTAYLNDFNAREAWKVVHPNSNDRTAGVEACLYLKKSNVMREIDRQLSILFESVNLKNEAILAEQMKIAFVDVRGFYNDDGTFKGMDNLNIAQQSAIEAIEIEELYEGTGSNRVSTGRSVKIKFYSRQKALDSLMKYRGMIKENNSFNFKINNNIQSAELKVDVKQLKEKLGADTIIELNRRLSNSRTN